RRLEYPHRSHELISPPEQPHLPDGDDVRSGRPALHLQSRLRRSAGGHRRNPRRAPLTQSMVSDRIAKNTKPTVNAKLVARRGARGASAPGTRSSMVMSSSTAAVSTRAAGLSSDGAARSRR